MQRLRLPLKCLPTCTLNLSSKGYSTFMVALFADFFSHQLLSNRPTAQAQPASSAIFRLLYLRFLRLSIAVSTFYQRRRVRGKMLIRPKFASEL